VRISGVKAHIAHVKAITGPEAIREVGQALYAGGQKIEVDAEISITAGSVSGKNHVPSLPGQPPNRDTGVLDGNIETTQVAPLKVEVSSNAPYAAALEVGTSKMAARPYMEPAAAKNRAEVTKMVRDAVSRVVQRTGGKAPG
jgi:HK97 gp10 family phage protein